MNEDKAKSQDRPALSKAEKLLGNTTTGTLQKGQPQGFPESQPEGSPTNRVETKLDFTDSKTTLSKNKPKFPKIAQRAATELISERGVIDEGTYRLNLMQAKGENKTYKPLTIQTCDGARISGLEIGDPKSKKCIIVFQPKDGNFKDVDSLRDLFDLAKENDAKVIAFNYRDRPHSLDAFDYDGAAVIRYALDSTETKNISVYGESLGAAIAAETAAKFKEEEGIVVKGLFARPPQSLADVVKHADTKQLKENAGDNTTMKKNIATLAGMSKLPKVFIEKAVKKIFGRDFDTNAALGKLDPKHFVCLRVSGDAMMTEKAGASHTVIGFTDEKDKHNAPLRKISVGTPQSKEPQALKQGMTGMDLLRDLVKKPAVWVRTTPQNR